jgi:Arc/MetJ-type ribon-helix-helix transcriptional regulator
MASAVRSKESQGCVIGSKITRSELTQIQDLIDAGVYLNASDFVREAIRDKLAAIKVIKCRDVDYETAKKEIIGYFQRKQEAYPDEISQDLELDFDLVRRITAELKKEGRLEAI